MAQKKTRPPNRGNRSRNRKHTNANNTVAIVISIVFAIFFIYLGGSIINYINKPDIHETVVEYGIVELPKTVEGIIIRDEVVYKSPAEGVVQFNFNDLEKVKKNSVICSIQDAVTAETLNKSIAEMEQSILDLQKKRGDISAFGKEAMRKNEQIQELVENGLSNYISGDFSAIYDLKSNVERNLNLRNQMYLSEERGSVKEMVAEKNSYQQQLSESIAQVVNDDGGILCYRVDGLEDVLTFEGREHILPEQTRMAVEHPVTTSNPKVGDSIFKILRSNEWYIATYVPYSLISDWEEGSGKTIYIQSQSNSTPLQMTIEKITHGETNSFVLLKATKSVLDYIDARGVQLRITEDQKKGFKIPNGAIVDKTLLKIPNSFVHNNNEVTSVVKRDGDTDTSVNIRVQSEADGFTYIVQDFNSVKLGDVIVDSADKSKTMSVSELINAQGVFVIRGGYANFVQIKAPAGASGPEGYTIIDPSENNRIKEDDRIVTDAANISEGQKIW